MIDTDQQNEFLKECEFIRVSIMLKPFHMDFLKKIDTDNVNKAVRMIIDGYMKQTKMIVFQKYILYIVFVLCVLIFGFLIYPIINAGV